MYRYQVGQLYNPRITRWPETPHLLLDAQAGPELTLFYGSPTAREVEQVRTGRIRFAWIDSDHTAIIAFRIGDLPWSDAPYHPHREKADGRDPGVPGTDDESVLCFVVLVDADTGIIAAMRMVSWPAEFAGAVRRSVQRLMAAPYSKAATDATLKALYDRYTSEQLARTRTDMTCVCYRRDDPALGRYRKGGEDAGQG